MGTRKRVVARTPKEERDRQIVVNPAAFERREVHEAALRVVLRVQGDESLRKMAKELL